MIRKRCTLPIFYVSTAMPWWRREAMRALEKHVDSVEGEGWAVRLSGIGRDELAYGVSRQQLAAVKEVISKSAVGGLLSFVKL